jgi:hypothetical protein
MVVISPCFCPIETPRCDQGIEGPEFVGQTANGSDGYDAAKIRMSVFARIDVIFWRRQCGEHTSTGMTGV